MMALHEPITTVNNEEENQLVDVECSCDFLWSMAHAFCYVRLSEKVAENEYDLIDLYAARARRIAATYARFYLETEEGGEPSKKGRYYWMALGAFASKTVACLLDSFQVKSSYFVGEITYEGMQEIANGLARGNFWLFVDIAAWHWFYSNHTDDFRQGMVCELKRSATDLEPAMKQATYAMPWAERSLPKIKHFKPSDAIIKGFDLIIKAESAGPLKLGNTQLEGLLAIAEHEQGAVLQPLIYNDPAFNRWTKMERIWIVKLIAPTYQIVFNHACDTEDESVKSVAPDDLIVENYKSRMSWIRQAALLFHDLMQTQTDYMEGELNSIASWVDEADATWVY